MTLSPLFEGTSTREAQFYFEEFFNFVSEPAIVFDNSLHLISANNAFYETFQISREDSEDRELFEHGDGKWKIAGLGQLLKTVASPGSADESIEVRHQFKNSGERVLQLKARRIESKGLKSYFIVLLIADVTDLRNLEKDSSFLKAILEYIPEGILITDVNHIVRKVSNFMGKILNVPAEELLHLDEPGRLKLLDWYWPNGEQITQPDYLPLSKSAIKGRIYQDYEILVKHDGETKVLSANAAPIRDKKGAIIGAIGAWRDITDIKKTELSLRESEEKYAKAFNSSPVALALTSLEDGTLAEVNEAFSLLTGYSHDELIGRTSLELGITTPEIRQKSKEKTRLKNRVYLEETQIRTRNGQLRDIIFSAEVLELQGKQFFLSTSMDITERKRAEDQLHRAHALLQSVTQGTEDMIAAEDLEFRYTYFNEAYAREFRKLWKQDIKIGTSMLEAMAPWPEERQKAYDLWHRALQGESFNITLEFGPTEKEKQYYDLRFNPLRDPEGRVVGAAHFLRDVTAEVRTKNALRRSEERWNLALENIEAGVIIATEEAQVIYWNPAARKMHGLTSPDEGFRPLEETFDLWTPDRRHKLELDERPVRRIKRGETVQGYELRLHRPDQGWEKYISYSGSMVETAEGEKLIFLSLYDLTELRSRTEDLAAANRELEAFSYSVSHDLRAPLHVISNLSSSLRKHSRQLDSTANEILQRIEAGAKKMNHLINDILRLSKISRHRIIREEIDLSSMARTFFTQLQQQNQGRHVEVRIDDDLMTQGDAQLLSIALNNLFRNAWKYTSKEAEACIEVGSCEQFGKQAFFIRDNGAGFSMEQADRLFQPFQRLHSDSEFPGTGIGLPIVQRVINRHGGEIWAESEVGKGATFYFTLG